MLELHSQLLTALKQLQGQNSQQVTAERLLAEKIGNLDAGLKRFESNLQLLTDRTEKLKVDHAKMHARLTTIAGLAAFIPTAILLWETLSR